jgi:hypothetical protein
MPETGRELAHEVVEEVKHLEHEAEEGETARTPVIVLTFLAYYVTK